MRMIFSTVLGPHEPALTVGSFAITQTGRPAIAAIPVTTPSAPKPSFSQFASSASSANEPESTSRSILSRTGSLPCSADFSWWRSGPPARARSRASWRLFTPRNLPTDLDPRLRPATAGSRLCVPRSDLGSGFHGFACAREGKHKASLSSLRTGGAMHIRPLVLATALVAVLGMALASVASAASYDPDTLLVKFRAGTSAAQRAAALDVPGVGRDQGTIGGISTHVVSVSKDPAALARVLNASSAVAYAEPNFVLRALATPNDSLYTQEYGLNNTGQTGGTADADIDAPEGWDLAGLAAFPNTGGVKVGIVDTGIDKTPPDLAGKAVGCATSYNAGTLIVNGVCTDDNGHGSHVSGTISANTNNGQGVAGVAFNSPLVMCKALATAAGTGLTSDIANCINWVAGQGVKVISMSLGGGDNATLKSAVQNAYAGGNGVRLCAAAGNDGNATLNYPAAYPDVVSVAATDNRDQRASFSNANADVEVAAPGVNVESTYTGGLYMSLSGTSMATPHVAGVAAVISGLNPTANAATVRSKLDAAVDDIGASGRDQSFGFGRVNLCKAAGGGCS